jgi:hypothetical protein
MKDKYSQFSAEVYIVASEQEELYRTQLIGHAIIKPSTSRQNRKLKTSGERLSEAKAENN